MLTINGNTPENSNKKSLSRSVARFLLPAVYSKLLTVKMRKNVQRVVKETDSDIVSFFNEKTLFRYIEIETFNRCNGTCSFCPVNRHDDPREQARMSEETFHKIIDNLKDLKYDGAIAYYSNNEPLMDNRIVDFIRYGVESLPNAEHRLYTNGTLLTVKKFLDLQEAGLTYLNIDNYNDQLEMIPSVKKVYEYLEVHRNDMSTKVNVSLRLNTEVLSTRGGTAPNSSSPQDPFPASCYLPFIQMIIRADGGVSLCCHDALGKHTLGDVEKERLEDIWFGSKHFSYLEMLRDNYRNGINICRQCDILASKSSMINSGVLPSHF